METIEIESNGIIESKLGFSEWVLNSQDVHRQTLFHAADKTSRVWYQRFTKLYIADIMHLITYADLIRFTLTTEKDKDWLEYFQNVATTFCW